MAKKKRLFYAVAKGRKVGIFHSWPDCESQVKGWPGAMYKGFQTQSEAHQYISQINWDYRVQHEKAIAKGLEQVDQPSIHNSNQAAGPSRIPFANGNGLSISNGIPSSSNLNRSASAEQSRESGSNDASDPVDATEADADQAWTPIASARRIIRDAKSSRGSKRSSGSEATSIHSNKQPKLEDVEVISSADADAKIQKTKGVRIIKVYTDGACPANGKAEARAGWGVYWPESEDVNSDLHGKNEFARVSSGPQTNQRAELIAMIRAIQLCPDEEAQLMIYTDSRYSMNAINDWQQNWRSNGWLNSKKEAVSNKDLIRRLEREMRSRPLRPILVKVKGHSGDPGNEEADSLAVKGATMPMDPSQQWPSLEEPSDSEEENDERNEEEAIQRWMKFGFSREKAEQRAVPT